MGFKFNPLTGKLDMVGSGGSVVSLSTIIKAILIDSKQDIDLPVASILFDEDSILYNDDEEI